MDIQQQIADWVEVRLLKRDRYFEELLEKVDQKDLPQCRLKTFANNPLYMELWLNEECLGCYPQKGEITCLN